MDLETTGSNPYADAIMEIGAARYAGGEVVAEWSVLVDPHRPIPPFIQELTGITQEMVRGQMNIGEAMDGLRDFVGTDLIIAHNAPFDLGFLRAQGWPDEHPSLDTLELYRLLFPLQEGHGLAAAARHMHFEFQHHRAGEDARITALVYGRLREALRSANPSLLHFVGQLVEGVPGSLAALLQAADRAAAPAPPWQPARPRVDFPPAGELRMPVDASAAFTPDGLIGSLGLEERASQRDLLERIEVVLEEGGVLVAEAPTGTGKSLAYLLPAMAWALREESRVVVSTGTKNLQEQLLEKDLPALQEATGWPVRAQLLKGRQNYLCLWRWQGEVAQALALLPGEERLQLARIAFWLDATPSGDRAEMRIDADLWARLEATAETCSGDRCALYHECYFYASRRRAEASHVLVVNHALLLEDAARGGGVLPEYDRLILDEAHGLDAAATDHLGADLSQRDARRLAQRAASLGGGTALTEAARSVQSAAGQAFAAAHSRFPGKRSARLRPDYLQAPESLPLRAAFSNLSTALGEFARAADESGISSSERLQIELHALAETARRTRGIVEEVLIADPGQVAWLDWSDREEGSLHLAPLYPGQLLQELLFQKLEACVLTSATLSVGESFDYLLEAIGLRGDARVHTVALPTPFFFRDQCSLLVPTDLPEPKDPAFDLDAQRFLLDALRVSGGRSLVLFTAHRQLRAFAEALREPLKEMGLRLLAQGVDGPRSRLIEALRREPKVVVFGAQSFWEGVDVIGDALSLVVLVKLPFQPPDRPVWEARYAALEAEGRSSFQELSLPDAALRLKQGFGRLIRSSTDQGAVLVLDRRLVTARYGHYLLDALPDAERIIGEQPEILKALSRVLR
ncbi:MAG: exonuclease domain-containing protein [Thermaerobacter sp.]|nr:exonuclease domain-containing protein [Thermaerobacter sp.]